MKPAIHLSDWPEDVRLPRTSPASEPSPPKEDERTAPTTSSTPATEMTTPK